MLNAINNLDGTQKQLQSEKTLRLLIFGEDRRRLYNCSFTYIGENVSTLQYFHRRIYKRQFKGGKHQLVAIVLLGELSQYMKRVETGSDINKLLSVIKIMPST